MLLNSNPDWKANTAGECRNFVLVLIALAANWVSLALSRCWLRREARWNLVFRKFNKSQIYYANQFLYSNRFSVGIFSQILNNLSTSENFLQHSFLRHHNLITFRSNICEQKFSIDWNKTPAQPVVCGFVSPRLLSAGKYLFNYKNQLQTRLDNWAFSDPNIISTTKIETRRCRERLILYLIAR